MTNQNLAIAFGVVALGLFVFRPSTPPTPAPAARPTPVATATSSTGSQEAKVRFLAERKLKAAMRNPDSMVIRNAYVPKASGYLCGEVNAENGFGGKTGFQRFIAGAASEMPIATEENMKASEFASAWSKLC